MHPTSPCEDDLTAADEILLTAMKTGDIGAARAALAAGANPNLAPDGYPLLCTCAGQGHLETVDLLLAHGADPNSRGGEGHTAMMMASFAPSPKAVAVLESLSRAGADINAQSENGRTALDAATDLKNTPAILWLHGKGATGRKASVQLAKRLAREQAGPNR